MNIEIKAVISQIRKTGIVDFCYVCKYETTGYRVGVVGKDGFSFKVMACRGCIEKGGGWIWERIMEGGKGK